MLFLLLSFLSETSPDGIRAACNEIPVAVDCRPLQDQVTQVIRIHYSGGNSVTGRHPAGALYGLFCRHTAGYAPTQYIVFVTQPPSVRTTHCSLTHFPQGYPQERACNRCAISITCSARQPQTPYIGVRPSGTTYLETPHRAQQRLAQAAPQRPERPAARQVQERT